MLCLIRCNPESGHKKNHNKPEKQPEPVNRITIGYRQELNRLFRYDLRREYAYNHGKQHTKHQKDFLPYIHGDGSQLSAISILKETLTTDK